MRHDGQPAVGGNDHGIGGGDCFGANEVLTDPGQSIPAQGGDIRTNERFETDIASFADQGGAKTDLKPSTLA